MFDFKFKTRGMTNPQGKPKIFFSCHPEDFDLAFNKVCNDILEMQDCAIYYTENMDDTIPEQDMILNFDVMNLFVIPVTGNLLKTHNRAFDTDFQYAKKAGIPVLPILFEAGLDELYSEESCFGELQYINPFSTDPTEISYSDKLRRYLETLFINRETAERVRKAFDAYIFLSYRKKDRFYANELMRIIHSNRECRDIAIWYDEFLTPGESFNENISKILNDSSIFALLVTPNILEEPEGKPNFVMGNEYPAAKEIGITIVPAEMEYTDKICLTEKFTGIPECIDPHNTDSFKEYMRNTLSKLSIVSNDDDPEHNYLIGLAYRDGIDVEINRQKGLELIQEAASGGWHEAANELVLMYYYGLFVDRDLEKAAYWQNKYIEVLRKEIFRDSSTKLKFDLIDALRFETEIHRNSTEGNTDYNHLIELCEEALELCDQIELTTDYASSRFVESKLNTLRSLAILYEFVGNYDEAFATYHRALELWNMIQKVDETIDEPRTVLSNKWRIAQIHHDIGILLEKKSDYSAAIMEFEEACLIYQDIVLDVSDYIPNMIGVYNAIAHSAAYVDVRKANEYSRTALELSEALYTSNPKLYDLIYAKALLSRAFVLSESATLEFDELEALCIKAVSIFENHRDDYSHETLFDLMNALYKLAGVYRRKLDVQKADRYYRSSIEISKELIQSAGVEGRESIAHLHFDYGTFLIGSSSEKGIDFAKSELNLALNLFKEVSEFNSTCNKYIEETEEVLNSIKNYANEADIQAEREKLTEADTRKTAAYYQCQYFYERGDTAEQARNYEKALLHYRAALEQIEILESLDAPFERLTTADIYDRIALCFEMLREYNDAMQNYMHAMLLATAEAKETNTSKAYTAAINYAWKLASFCDEFGDKEAAKKHYEFREFLIAEKDRLFGTSSSDSVSTENDEDVSKDFRKELEEALERLDFTPTTFSEGEEIDYSEGLFEDGDDDISALFDALFGSTLADEEEKADRPSVITLTGEDGIDVDFEFVDVFGYQAQEYAVLIPCDRFIHGLVILKVEKCDDGDEDYTPVEDDALLSVLFDIFKERNKDRFNFSDD